MPSTRRRIGAGRPGRVFVDSGAWIALFSARDGHHREADRLFNRAAAQRIPLVTTSLVIAEVHRFQLFHVGIRAAARSLAVIDTSRLVTIEFAGTAHHVRALAWLARLSDQRLSYTDAVSFAVMEAAHCRVALSFDEDFSVAGFRLWHHDG